MASDLVMERYADRVELAQARLRHERILVAIVACLCGVLLVQNHRLVGGITRLQGPAFVFMNESGQYRVERFKPYDPAFTPVVKSSLLNFLRKHFRRRRADVAEDYPESLMFMSAELASPLERAIQDGEIAKFIQDLSQPEVE